MPFCVVCACPVIVATAKRMVMMVCLFIALYFLSAKVVIFLNMAKENGE